MRRLVNFLVLLGLGVGLIILSPFCYAQNTASFDSKLISVDFKEADLKDVIGILSVMTGLNIALDDDVEGEVTARFEDIPVLQALQMILEINDCQYEILDDIIKVTKIPILTQSFPLEFALVSEVAELIKSLLSPEGILKINEETNTLVISDKGMNLEKIEEAIQEIDSPSLQLDTKVFSFKFIRADEAVSLIQDQLSEVGKVEIVLPTNSLQVTDTSYNLTKLEYLVSSLDISQRKEERTFTLKFALASDVKTKLISDYLNPVDEIDADEEKNEIILTSNPYTLGRVEEFLNGLDVPEKQISKKEFFAEYLSLEKLAGLVRENLSSWGEIVEQDKAKNILIAKDTSYNLFKIGKFIETFISLKATETYEIKFALASEMAELIKPLLSPEGSLKVSEATNTLVISDKGMNLEKIEEAIQEIDSPSRQLDTKVFSFEFIRADKAASLIQDQLSEVGKVEIVLLTNSLQVTDTSYNLTKLEYLVSSLDISQRKEERTFTLKFALASDVKTKLISDYLNPVDEIDADEEKNEIILTSNPYILGRVEEFLNGLDVPEKQISKKEFFVKDFKYLSLEKLAGLVRENLSSWGEIVEQDKAKNILIAKDTSYNLFKIGKFIETFISLKATETYEIKFALASEVAEVIKTFLSLEGRLDEVNDEKNTLVISDKKINLEKIAKTIQEIDSPSLQLNTKKYTLRYLTPQQVKEALQLRNILSEYGQIRLPEAGKEEGIGNGEDKRDYIIIPQEEIDSAEREESQESKISLEETKEAEDNVIYITVLKKNVLALKQAMKEIDSPSQVITRTFSMPEGSLEAIVVAIATMIGVSPEDIQGIEIGEETEWLKMKVTSPTIGLGDIGAVGKK